MEKPFLNKPYNEVWATDGHVALMVPHDVVSGKYPEKEKPLDWVHPKRTFEQGTPITCEMLRSALSKCDQEEIMEVDREEKSCPECNGCGKVEWSYTASHGDSHFYYAEHDCPICGGDGVLEEEHSHGTGKFMVSDFSGIRIGQVVFKASQFERVLEAAKIIGTDEVRLLHLPKSGDFNSNGMVLAFSPQIRLLVMPYLPMEEKDVVTLQIEFKED